MKRTIAIAIMVALILAQSTIAGAYTYDSRTNVAAGADFTGLASKTDLSFDIKNISNDASATPQELTWTANIGDDWTKSSQYVEAKYELNEVGWGIQIYTDNMETVLSPATAAYTGDPTTNIAQQPNGLVGQSNTLVTCPLALLVTKDVIATPGTNLVLPNEVEVGTPGQVGHLIYFDNGYAADSKVWFWLKDISSTYWKVDTNGDGIADAGEIKKTFNNEAGYPGSDDYATIVNTKGIATGYQTAGVTLRDYDLGTKDGNDDYTVRIYLAAKFTEAREKDNYVTGTLSLELFHQ